MSSVTVNISKDQAGRITGYTVTYWKQSRSRKGDMDENRDVTLMAQSRRQLVTILNQALDDLEKRRKE